MATMEMKREGEQERERIWETEKEKEGVMDTCDNDYVDVDDDER